MNRHFLPAINQSPTQNDTVQEVLNQVHKKTQKLGHQSADLVFDHAIYAKALEILNNPNNEHLRTSIHIRMGGFHACCILLRVFGKRFASAGLRDIIIETGLVGPSSVESVLRGKQYNYGMRIIKIVSEALFRLKLEASKVWLEQKNELNLLNQFLESKDMLKLIDVRNPENMQAVASTFANFQQHVEQFDQEILESKLGPTARFWQSFLDMSQLLLDYVKSFCLGDWELQLGSMERMLSWFHAYAHVNYARHFTYCFASLQKLPDNHPSIYREFQQGNFTVKRSNGNFNMLPPNQVIEQTINKDQKGPGGIIGFSTTIGCVQRWVLSSHVTASWTEDFKNSIGLDTVENKPKDIGKSRMKLDEQMVQQCYKTIEHWQNPFLPQENLLSLSSGAVASEKIVEDLNAAEDIGKASVQQFLKERIVEGTVEFNATIKKKKLATFDALNKVKTCKVKDEVVTIKSDRETFARMLVVQRNRGIDLQQVLKYELSSQPLALSNPDGSMSKTVKSKLFASLSASIDQLPTPPNNTPKIYDGMVLLHKLPPNLTTFGEISDYILKKMLSGTCAVSILVTDYYRDESIKSLERMKRSKIGSIRITALRRDQRKPRQFNKYLQNAANKTELVEFLIKDWSTNLGNVEIFLSKTLYVTCGIDAWKIDGDGVRINRAGTPALQSNQEEADTKVFLCASFVAELGYERVNIITVDSDIGILALYYQQRIAASLILEIGTGSNLEILDISTHTLSKSLTDALPALHAISGCDSISCFNGAGKAKCLSIAQSEERFLEALASLGESPDLADDHVATLEEYVCKLYGVKDCNEVNKAR